MSALRLRDKLKTMSSFQKFFDEHPDYRLTLVGHSLGGGVCALLSLLMRNGESIGFRLFSFFCFRIP
jgi:putative lipase involved disintegration of autophagic bodies